MSNLSERVRIRLVGRDRSHRLRALSMACVMGVLVVVLGTGLKVSGWLPEAFVATTPLAVGISLGVLLCGCLAASRHASRGGGLLPSWLLVGVPLSAWLGLYHFDPTHPASTAAVVSGIALLTVPVAGSCAYAVGQLGQRRAGNTWDVSADPVLRVLIGTHPKRVGYWGLLAATLLVIAVAGVARGAVPVAVVVPFGALGGSPLVGAMITLTWISLAALPGYRRDGLLASWVLIFCPLFGGLVTDAATDQFLTLPLFVDATTNGLLALGPTVFIGTLGFLLGTGVQRLAAANG